jgi:hypothetical protein
MKIDPPGLLEELEDQAAGLRELGYFQMLYGNPTDDGTLFVEGVACRLWAANGNPLIRMKIGPQIYLLGVEDLEKALSAPAPQQAPTITLHEPPTPDFCRGIRGALFVARFVLEEDEDLLEPMVAVILESVEGYYELQVMEQRFIFDPEDFWEAMTDPATFRTGDTGPVPIDVLRDSIEPAG